MENRLSLLCDAGVIDEDICRGMLQVVRRLDEEWKLAGAYRAGNDGDNPHGQRVNAQSSGRGD